MKSSLMKKNNLLKKKKSPSSGFELAGNLICSAEETTPCVVKIRLNDAGRWWMLELVGDREKIEHFSESLRYVDLEFDGLEFRVDIFAFSKATGVILMAIPDFFHAFGNAWRRRWKREYRPRLERFPASPGMDI
jgi:hypothetical protein